MLISSDKLLITVSVAVVASEFYSVSVGVVTCDVVKYSEVGDHKSSLTDSESLN